MMKNILALVALLLVSLPLSAQNYQKNILGIRGGLNIAKGVVELGEITKDLDNRVGFHLGVSDQILLTSKHPLYLDLGLGITSVGGELDGVKDRPLYIQIPVLLNYHFSITPDVNIQPFGGFYYALGISGKTEDEDGYKYDYFGDESFKKRSDLGLRFGVGVTYKKIYFGFQYDWGLYNVMTDDITISDSYNSLGGAKLERYNRCFSISIGYNF